MCWCSYALAFPRFLEQIVRLTIWRAMATKSETFSNSVASSPTVAASTLDCKGEKDVESGLEHSPSGTAAYGMM